MASRPAARARADETWQKLVRHRPGVEDLLDGKLVPVALIDPNPDQPRRGRLEGIEELAASIAEYGLLQPIVVAPPHSGRYTCIAGHRRLAAYRRLFETHLELGRWAAIPAIERDTAGEDRIVLALLENLSRQDLSDADVITGLRVLHDLRGWSQREIARRLGVSSGWIAQYFRVAGDADVSGHVQAGRLSVATAYEIVRAAGSPERGAALDAALQGATRRVIRHLAKEGPGASRPDLSGDATDAGGSAHTADRSVFPGDQASGASHRGSPGLAKPGGAAGPEGRPVVVTAAVDAGVRDLAELANALGVTGRLRDLQITKLVRAALDAGTDEFDAAAFLRLVRADIRHVEAMVRATSAQREGA